MCVLGRSLHPPLVVLVYVVCKWPPHLHADGDLPRPLAIYVDQGLNYPPDGPQRQQQPARHGPDTRRSLDNPLLAVPRERVVLGQNDSSHGEDDERYQEHVAQPERHSVPALVAGGVARVVLRVVHHELNREREQRNERARLRVQKVQHQSALLDVLPHASVPRPKQAADENEAHAVRRELRPAVEQVARHVARLAVLVVSILAGANVEDDERGADGQHAVRVRVYSRAAVTLRRVVLSLEHRLLVVLPVAVKDLPERGVQTV